MATPGDSTAAATSVIDYHLGVILREVDYSLYFPVCICHLCCIFYPAICSILRDTNFTVAFSFFYVRLVGYRFLSRRFTDRHEILHGGSATSRTDLHLF